MLTEAAKQGFYETPVGKSERLQIRAVPELLEGKQPHSADRSVRLQGGRSGGGSNRARRTSVLEVLSTATPLRIMESDAVLDPEYKRSRGNTGRAFPLPWAAN